MTNRATNEDWEDHWVLQGIVALLLSLADIAERSASAPQFVRINVLWLLRPAEAVARKLALEVVWSPDLADLPPEAALSDDSPAEALRIAACLRSIACMLSMLVEYFGCVEDWPARPLSSYGRDAHRDVSAAVDRQQPAWFDTS